MNDLNVCNLSDLAVESCHHCRTRATDLGDPDELVTHREGER